MPSGAGPVDPPILTGGGGPADFLQGDPSGAGMADPHLSYTPADLWTRIDPNMGFIDPSVTINPANPADAAAYPAPGAQPPPSLGRRIVNNIPAVRLAHLLGRVFQPRNQWQQNATRPPPTGGGGPTVTPATAGIQSQDWRFSDNGVTGNYVADQTMNNFLASGGYKGVPNRAVAPDSGKDRFSPQSGFTGQINEDTGLLERQQSAPIAPFNINQRAGAPPLRAGDPASVAAYNAWLREQPEYQQWLDQNSAVPGIGVAPASASGLGPAARVPRIRISGPPGGV